jgi:ABC-2 type transport system permease protein
VAAVVVTVGIAALANTGEFATGSIRTTVAATPPRWAVLTAKAAVVGALTSLLVVGLGAVLRSAAGTITTAVAVLFAPPILGALVSNEIVATVLDYLPAGLSAVLVSGTGERYSPEVAALLLGAWAVEALAAGMIALHRRDP